MGLVKLVGRRGRPRDRIADQQLLLLLLLLPKYTTCFIYTRYEAKTIRYNTKF